MPKVFLTVEQKQRDILMHNLKLLKGGQSAEDMAKKVGMKRGTLQNRLRDGKLATDEVARICDKYHINVGDFMSKYLKIS